MKLPGLFQAGLEAPKGDKSKRAQHKQGSFAKELYFGGYYKYQRIQVGTHRHKATFIFSRVYP